MSICMTVVMVSHWTHIIPCDLCCDVTNDMTESQLVEQWQSKEAAIASKSKIVDKESSPELMTTIKALLRVAAPKQKRQEGFLDLLTGGTLYLAATLPSYGCPGVAAMRQYFVFSKLQQALVKVPVSPAQEHFCQAIADAMSAFLATSESPRKDEAVLIAQSTLLQSWLATLRDTKHCSVIRSIALCLREALHRFAVSEDSGAEDPAHDFDVSRQMIQWQAVPLCSRVLQWTASRDEQAFFATLQAVCSGLACANSHNMELAHQSVIMTSAQEALQCLDKLITREFLEHPPLVRDVARCALLMSLSSIYIRKHMNAKVQLEFSVEMLQALVRAAMTCQDDIVRLWCCEALWRVVAVDGRRAVVVRDLQGAQLLKLVLVQHGDDYASIASACIFSVAISRVCDLTWHRKQTRRLIVSLLRPAAEHVTGHRPAPLTFMHLNAVSAALCFLWRVMIAHPILRKDVKEALRYVLDLMAYAERTTNSAANLVLQEGCQLLCALINNKVVLDGSCLVSQQSTLAVDVASLFARHCRLIVQQHMQHLFSDTIDDEKLQQLPPSKPAKNLMAVRLLHR
eukprot:TRINITY_DN9793_c1_g1_i9.p1 TRINITY_DN9793_c1_g1~~TRINITY_DN9793_c1_g1_i9.p1  ORF type:complete len:570 (+),score=129.27 TRINITY_DN9793_c1_g1_i9:801-2510(+)